MKKIHSYIPHQIWNEKRANTALFLELLIVGTIVWFIVDAFFCMFCLYHEPMGTDITRCYQLQVEKLDASSQYYDKSIADTTDVNYEYSMRLLRRIQAMDDIELAAYSHHATPYDLSFMGCQATIDTTTFLFRRLLGQPDLLRIFNFKSAEGKTAEELAAIVEKGEILISENIVKKEKLGNVIGKTAVLKGGELDSFPRRIGGLIQPVKRAKNEGIDNIPCFVAFVNIEPTALANPDFLQLSVKVKEEHEQGFEERMHQQIRNRGVRCGNFYISDVRSYKSIEQVQEKGDRSSFRWMGIAMGFLLLNVFLGMLGTFWFRTQHRFPEIGLQKAMGASNSVIALRLLCEAALIMTAAFIPVIIIAYNIAHEQLTMEYNGWFLEPVRFLTGIGITYVILLVVIGLSIWFPARKAMKANPIEVLRTE